MIKEWARLIRKLIIQMEPDELPRSLQFDSFPKGCCGDASRLLAKFLTDKGISVEWVRGEKDDFSHAWVEHEGYIIDITADQFPEIAIEVMVTYDRTCHDQFDQQERWPGDFEEYETFNRKRLLTIYYNMLARLSE